MNTDVLYEILKIMLGWKWLIVYNLRNKWCDTCWILLCVARWRKWTYSSLFGEKMYLLMIPSLVDNLRIVERCRYVIGILTAVVSFAVLAWRVGGLGSAVQLGHIETFLRDISGHREHLLHLVVQPHLGHVPAITAIILNTYTHTYISTNIISSM